jgi:DNA-binding response OmpR family regulator
MAKKKILIIDDEQSITRLLKFALEKSGLYEVLTENLGAKAVSQIKASRPDLLILDVNLPDASGGEIAAEIREDASLKNLPIIFLTGSVTEEEAQAGLTIGGFPALGKPINMEKLLERVQKSIQ